MSGFGETPLASPPENVARRQAKERGRSYVLWELLPGVLVTTPFDNAKLASVFAEAAGGKVNP